MSSDKVRKRTGQLLGFLYRVTLVAVVAYLGWVDSYF